MMQKATLKLKKTGVPVTLSGLLFPLQSDEGVMEHMIYRVQTINKITILIQTTLQYL